MRKEVKLNGKTPKWFRDWHYDHYSPDKERMIGNIRRNEKFIYLIIATILGTSVVGSTDVDMVRAVLQIFSGG